MRLWNFVHIMALNVGSGTCLYVNKSINCMYKQGVIRVLNNIHLNWDYVIPMYINGLKCFI